MDDIEIRKFCIEHTPDPAGRVHVRKANRSERNV